MLGNKDEMEAGEPLCGPSNEQQKERDDFIYKGVFVNHKDIHRVEYTCTIPYQNTPPCFVTGITGIL